VLKSNVDLSINQTSNLERQEQKSEVKRKNRPKQAPFCSKRLFHPQKSSCCLFLRQTALAFSDLMVITEGKFGSKAISSAGNH
jgi:hypothetical protein